MDASVFMSGKYVWRLPYKKEEEKIEQDVMVSAILLHSPFGQTQADGKKCVRENERRFRTLNFLFEKRFNGMILKVIVCSILFHRNVPYI